jgi:hypothetical protein
MSSTYTVNYTASDVVWGGGTYNPPTTDYDPNNPDHCAVALMQTEGGWGVVDGHTRVVYAEASSPDQLVPWLTAYANELAEFVRMAAAQDAARVVQASQQASTLDPTVAWERPDTEPCEQGTTGCSIKHTAPGADAQCECW